MRKDQFILGAGVALLLILAAPVSAGTTTIDFEALSHLQNAHAYLAGFGITVIPEPGSQLVGADDTLVYGGGAVDAPSGKMYLHQIGTVAPAFPPNTFTLSFATTLDSFGFSDSAILVPSITSPWTATARDGGGGFLDSASFAGAVVHPTLSYTLTGPDIKTVTFVQTAWPHAAFFGGNYDDFILTRSRGAVPEPATIWLLGFAALGLLRRRR